MKKAFESIRGLFNSLIKTLKSAYSIMVIRFKIRDGFRKTVEELIKEAYQEFVILNKNLGVTMAYHLISSEYGYATMMWVINEFHKRGYFKNEER